VFLLDAVEEDNRVGEVVVKTGLCSSWATLVLFLWLLLLWLWLWLSTTELLMDNDGGASSTMMGNDDAASMWA
jgi:hypothetical protein